MCLIIMDLTVLNSTATQFMTKVLQVQNSEAESGVSEQVSWSYLNAVTVLTI